MDRRRFLLTSMAGALAAPLAAAAQQAGKMPRVGWLGDDPATTHFREAFRQALRDLGYVEDRDLTMEYRLAEGKPERFPAVAAELSALNPDVIVAVNILAAQAAKQVTKTIPIVFVSVGDPVASGLVTSLARPGGNVTGLSSTSHDLIGKRLELLKQAAPAVRRVAILWQPGGRDESAQREGLQQAEVAARVLDVRLQMVEVRRPDDLGKAFSEIGRARAGAVDVFGSVVFFNARGRLVDLVAKSRLPAIYFAREFVDAGGLMAYASDYRDQYRRAAIYVDKILKGAKPADLPVEQPTKFEVVINLKTAKALGLTIPPSLLARADQVIE